MAVSHMRSVGSLTLRPPPMYQNATAWSPRHSQARGPWSEPPLCLRGLRHHAELLHHPERVPVGPTLDDLAVLEAVDGDAADGHVLAAGRHSHQLPVLGAGGRPAGGHIVAVRDLLLDFEVAVRECRAVH